MSTLTEQQPRAEMPLMPPPANRFTFAETLSDAAEIDTTTRFNEIVGILEDLDVTHPETVGDLQRMAMVKKHSAADDANQLWIQL